MKEFTDESFEFDEKGRKLSKLPENTAGKGEIALYEQFLLFPQCFQKACFPGASKGVIVWEWVKLVPNLPVLLPVCCRVFYALTLSQTSPGFYVSEVQVS